MLSAIYPSQEHNVHREKGKAELKVELVLDGRMSFSLLATATLYSGVTKMMYIINFMDDLFSCTATPFNQIFFGGGGKGGIVCT